MSQPAILVNTIKPHISDNIYTPIACPHPKLTHLSANLVHCVFMWMSDLQNNPAKFIKISDYAFIIQPTLPKKPLLTFITILSLFLLYFFHFINKTQMPKKLGCSRPNLLILFAGGLFRLIGWSVRKRLTQFQDLNYSMARSHVTPRCVCHQPFVRGLSSSGSNITPWHSGLDHSLSTSNSSSNWLLRFSFSITSQCSLYSVIPHHVLTPCPSPFWTNHQQCFHVLTTPLPPPPTGSDLHGNSHV